jgi:2'-5' RNA ligase
VRLFVACEPPLAIAAELAAWAAQASARDPALRLLGPDALHLTLAFLGEVATGDVGTVEDVMGDALRDEPWPSALRVGEGIWLAPRTPHVLAVEISDEDGALTALQGRLSTGLADAIGFTPERRAYLPHVTVARVRRGRAPRDLDLDRQPAPSAFAAEAVALVRSHLGPEGATYETVLAFGPGDADRRPA